MGNSTSFEVLDNDKKISVLVDRKDWDKLIKLLYENKDYASKIDIKNNRLPIHVALLNDASVELINLLILYNPKGLQVKDCDGMLPLHYACMKDSPLSIIDSLINEYPSSCTEGDLEGKLPLHYGCANRINIDSFNILVKSYQDSVSRRTKQGKLCIHYAVEHRISLQVLNRLLELYPMGTKEFCKGRLPLHYACESKCSFEIINALVTVYEESAKIYGIDGMLALHSAVANRSKLDVITLLLLKHPDGIRDRDRQGRLSIHYALENQAPNDVIHTLIKADPKTIGIKGRGGHLPLHIAIEKKCSTDIILALIEAFPQSVRENDMTRVLPLRRAIKENLPVEVVMALLNSYPEGASDIDDYGRLSLHYAASRCLNIDMLNALICASPQGSRVIDINGQLPLHLCIKRNSSPESVQILVDSNPEGVLVTDNYGMTALHYAIEVEASSELINILLVTNPQCASIKINGKVPLLHCIEFRRSIEIIKLILDAYPEGAKEQEPIKGRLPITWAMERNLSLDILLLLESGYDANESAFIQDIDGALPIHYALKYFHPVEIVQILLKAHPKIVFQKDLTIYHKKDEEYENVLAIKESNNKIELNNIIVEENQNINDENINQELKDDLIIIQNNHFESLLHDNIKLNKKEKKKKQKKMEREGKLLIHYACENLFALPDSVAELLFLSMPFSHIDGKPNPRHYFTWTFILSETNDRYAEAVDIVLKRYPDHLLQLLNDAPDEKGSKAVDCATVKCQKEILRRMYYFGRYELQPGPYRHQSENSLVKLAWDHEDKKRVVALKFIKSKIQFEREIFRRSQTLLSSDYVIQAMRSHDGDSDLTYRQETERKGFGIYPYCVILAAAERDLQSIIQHEFFAGGRDLNVIRSTCTQILLAIQHLHTKGVIHGDIKPLNLMRENGVIKFIDFGASVSFAKLEFAGGVHTSTAFLPPEMVRIAPSHSNNENEKTNVPTRIELDTDGSPVDRSINEYKLSSKTGLPIYGESTVELLQAHPTMDIWSFGVLFYYICTGETLFLSNVEDEIDTKQLQILSFWPEEFKTQRLSLIADPILKCLTAQLLNKEPRRRPKVKHILNHPFFTRVIPSRLPGMPATYDICLVYRRKEKRAKAKQADEDKKRKEKEAERQRLMDEALENGEEWIEPIEKKKKKKNNYHDDKHVDDFKVVLENQGFSVCDCYDEDGLYEEGNGLNIIKSKVVIVILSRFAINFDVNNFENLVGDSSYDHLLFQLRLAIELKSLRLIEGGINVIGIGDKLKKNNPIIPSSTSIDSDSIIKNSDLKSGKDNSNKNNIISDYSISNSNFDMSYNENSTINVHKTVEKSNKKKLEDIATAEIETAAELLRSILPAEGTINKGVVTTVDHTSVVSDVLTEIVNEESSIITHEEVGDESVEYGSYYDSYNGDVLGRYGGCHPTGCQPLAVKVVESTVRRILLNEGLGEKVYEVMTVLDVMTEIIACPFCPVTGFYEEAWKTATDWVLEIPELAAIVMKNNEVGNSNENYNANDLKKTSSKVDVTEEDEDVEKMDVYSDSHFVNIATISLLNQKLNVKQIEISSLEEEVNTLKKKLELSYAENKKLRNNLNMGPIDIKYV